VFLVVFCFFTCFERKLVASKLCRVKVIPGSFFPGAELLNFEGVIFQIQKIWAQNEEKDVILVVLQKLFTPSTMEQKNRQRTCNCKASDGASSEPGVQISVESAIFQTQ